MSPEDSIGSFDELQERYGGEYIAMLNNRVIAHKLTYGETNKAAILAAGMHREKEIRYRFIQQRKSTS